MERLLSFHMDGEQNMIFKDGDVIEDIIEKTNTVAETKFLKWMEYNRDHPEAQTLLYVEFPRHYVWDPSK